MNKYIFIFILLLTDLNLSSQNLTYKKTELKKIFRESIEQKSKKIISLDSNPWVTNNTDSMFYKADTIKLINLKEAPYNYGFCQIINWTFFKKDKFYLIESQTCKEPSSAKAGNASNFYIFKIRETEKGLILETYNSFGIENNYLVIGITKNETSNEILLKRINQLYN